MTKSQKWYSRLRATDNCRNYTKHGKDSLALRSLTETARILGISRQAVHQIERSAIYKLRLALAPLIEEGGRM